MPYLQKPQITRLKLSIACQELNRIFYKDELNAVLVIKTEKFRKQPQTTYTSKPVKNSFSPAFAEEITLTHTFEHGNRYLFQVYNQGNYEYPIGQVKLTVKDLLTAPDGVLVRELNSGFKLGGRILIQVEQMERNNEFIYLKLSGEGMMGNSWWGWFVSRQLYFKINKIWENHSESLYVSECLPINKIMQWKQFYIQFNSKFEQVEKSKLRVQLCQEKVQTEEIMAEADLQWKDLAKLRNFEIFDREKLAAGKFVISNFKVEREYSFDEFIRAGLEINLTIGIDFSASIKSPWHSESPHHSGKGKSHYLNALLALSSFISDYSGDQNASIFAVGAKARHPKIYTGDQVQQCFPLNADFEHPYIKGSEAITSAYLDVLNYLEFSGPTDFTAVIRRAMGQCLVNKRRKEEYSVLVILSDGKLFNTEKVREALEECATLPIYFVFLTVAGTSTDLQKLTSIKMEVYTGDKCLAERENMINIGTYHHKTDDLSEVASTVFKNLPHVVSRYMSLRKRTPEILEKAINKKLSESMTSSRHSNINPQI